MVQEIRKPIMGEPIYVPTALHVYRGVDDFQGGLCAVLKIKDGISAGKPVPFVQVKERLGTWYNWHNLVKNQDKYRERYMGRGQRAPDFRAQFNDSEEDWGGF